MAQILASRFWQLKDNRPVIATFVPDFLAGDMQHIYRQVVGLERYKPGVITRKRRNEDLFPLHEKWVTVMKKSPMRAWRRIWFRQVRREPVPLSLAETRDLFFAFQNHDAQVLHVYFGNTAVELLPFLRATPWPIVVSFHGADAGVNAEQSRYRERLKEVFRYAHLVMARSHSLLDRLREMGCPDEKLRLHRTCIPVNDIAFSQRTAPADGTWKFLQACRLVEKKGLPASLRAFAKIRQKYPAAQFDIVGDGPLRKQLEKEIRLLGLEGSVRLRGFLPFSQWSSDLAKTHFFLHPSQTGADGNVEGVPNAMLEAMAAGLPVAATLHGGIPEALDDGIGGILVKERDANAMAERVLAVMSDPMRYAAMSCDARESVVARFSHASQIALLEEIYDEAKVRCGRTLPMVP